MFVFNFQGISKFSGSVVLRKAISSAINFEDVKAVLAGNAIEAYSYLATCLDCGNKVEYKPGDTERYLRAYFAQKK